MCKAVPSTAVYYYHLKIMTGVNFRVDKILESCAARGLNNVVGAKFSDADIWELSCCMRACGGKFNLLYGKQGGQQQHHRHHESWYFPCISVLFRDSPSGVSLKLQSS